MFVVVVGVDAAVVVVGFGGADSIVLVVNVVVVVNDVDGDAKFDGLYLVSIEQAIV